MATDKNNLPDLVRLQVTIVVPSLTTEEAMTLRGSLKATLGKYPTARLDATLREPIPDYRAKG